MNVRYRSLVILIFLMLTIFVASSKLRADSGACGGATTTLPFTDVGSSIFFCQIAEAYFSGLTNGTSATTFSPSAPVTREQMAAFMTRTQDSALRRGSKTAALGQFWTTTPRYGSTLGGLGTTTIGANARFVESDGVDLWVANLDSGTVSRVRGSDGKVLDTWTGATGAAGMVVATGRVFVAGFTNPGKLYMIDPAQPAGLVTEVAQVTGFGFGGEPLAIAFDGSRIWTANGSSISIVVPGAMTPWPALDFSNGLSISPFGILYDGSNIWVTDMASNKLLEIDPNGPLQTIARSVTVGSLPAFPTFDGANIWVPNLADNSVTVVRASTGVVLATLTGNGLNAPNQAAFDGQRVLITNNGGDSVSLWKAADLTPIGTLSTGAGTHPLGACSDGINFWITLQGTNQLARF